MKEEMLGVAIGCVSQSTNVDEGRKEEREKEKAWSGNLPYVARG